MMKKEALFINLGDCESIVSSGQLISKIVDDERFASVSLLVLEKYRSAALVLNKIDKIITIDRALIESLFNNKIYPKHFSLNVFMEKIEYIENCNFDLIVNYSGDTVANYISGYFFSRMEICGPYCSLKNNICHADEWSVVGEIAEEMNYLPFNKNDVYGKIMGLKSAKGEGRYVVREKHERTVEHSLNKLKALNQYNGVEPVIVGVCVGAKESKIIPVKIIMDLLREMKSQKGILPLVITGTSDEDENAAKLINERFGHSLTLVKMDIVAAPSLIKGIDVLICPDNYFKRLANLVGTKTIELSFGDENAGEIGEGLLVTTSLEQRNFYKNNASDTICQERDFVKSSDIVKVIKYTLGNEKTNKLSIGSGAVVYEKNGSDHDFFCEKINEGREGEMSIHRVMTRNVIMLRFSNDGEFDKKIDYLFTHNSRNDLNKWINSERKLIVDLMKDILSVIRLVLQSQKDKNKTRELADKFDKLFSYEKINSPVKIPIIFLRNSIFSVDKSELILEEIYKTKSHVQKYNQLIQELDSCQRQGKLSRRRERFAGVENG